MISRGEQQKFRAIGTKYLFVFVPAKTKITGFGNNFVRYLILNSTK